MIFILVYLVLEAVNDYFLITISNTFALIVCFALEFARSLAAP